MGQGEYFGFNLRFCNVACLFCCTFAVPDEDGYLLRILNSCSSIHCESSSSLIQHPQFVSGKIVQRTRFPSLPAINTSISSPLHHGAKRHAEFQVREYEDDVKVLSHNSSVSIIIAELQNAIENENYALAAKIRDGISY